MASAVFGEAIPVSQLFEKILERPVEFIIHEDNQATMKVVEAGYIIKGGVSERVVSGTRVRNFGVPENISPLLGVVPLLDRADY